MKKSLTCAYQSIGILRARSKVFSHRRESPVSPSQPREIENLVQEMFFESKKAVNVPVEKSISTDDREEFKESNTVVSQQTDTTHHTFTNSMNKLDASPNNAGTSVAPTKPDSKLKFRQAALEKLQEIQDSTIEQQNRLISSSSVDDWYVGSALNVNDEMIPKWMKAMSQQKQPIQSDTNGIVDINTIVQCVKDHRAQNVVVIDVTKSTELMDFMIILEGKSKKQVYSIIDAVKRLFKGQNSIEMFMPHNISVEGEETDWMTLDTGKYMVHCFVPEAREQYDLDSLWIEQNLSKTTL